MGMAKVKVLSLTCKRCGHEWTPRQTDVFICPKCKSAKWDVERGAASDGAKATGRHGA